MHKRTSFCYLSDESKKKRNKIFIKLFNWILFDFLFLFIQIDPSKVDSDLKCPPLPELENGFWDCPGAGTGGGPNTLCTAECDDNFSSDNRYFHKQFTCDCANTELGCRWAQNPRSYNEINLADFSLTNVDANIFKIFGNSENENATVVWPECSAVQGCFPSIRVSLISKFPKSISLCSKRKTLLHNL